MYLRILKLDSWPDIEDKFAGLFGEDSGARSRGGLTSVYYRIRRNWGLEEVLKTGTDSPPRDTHEVEVRARHFSADFLTRIGYLTAD